MATIAELRHQILHTLLPHIPFDGWSDEALKRATEDAGLAPVDALRAFPEGAADALDYFMTTLDDAMVAGMAELPLASLRLHEKVRAALMLRFKAAAPHREALRRALAFYAMPHHLSAGTKRLYDTVDAVWRVAGDHPTDFSFYTKRMTLAGVYSTTVLFWLNDTSENDSATIEFLDRRLKDVLTFHKTKHRILNFFSTNKSA